MTIVIINDNAQINGGATKIAILNARDLADRGHDVFFLCAVLPVGPELNNPRITVICSEQFEILTDPSRLRAFGQGWWNPKAQRLTKELLASLDPERTIVHLHLWAKALSSSVAREVVSAGFPITCTLHDFLLACPIGTLFHHDEGAICHRVPMSLSCVSSNCDTRSYGQKLWRVGRQVIQRQFGWLPSGVFTFIAHSNLVANIMKPYLPPGAVIHHIAPYIESTQEPPALPAEHEAFLYLGRLVREKGVLLLARAARAEGIQVTFVGSGELAKEISAIDPSATITGWVDQARSVGYLRQSRALVFPSLWYETLGLVVLEAAAHGVPSIVPDQSAASEMVIDGVTGLHFRMGDEEDLRSQIRRLQDPLLAARLGKAAYDRFWSSDFASRRAHSQALEAIYSSTLERNRADVKPFATASSKGVA